MKLSLATWDHDRCMPLHEGRVSIPEEFESPFADQALPNHCSSASTSRSYQSQAIFASIT